MVEQKNMLYEKEVVPRYSKSGNPDFVDTRTGNFIDFYTGQPLVRATHIKTIAESVAELDE